MGKGKKGGKRMSRKQLQERLQAFFSSQGDRTVSFKEIFRALKLDTHPLKMLAIDMIEEMVWDDFLVKVTDSSYKLNTKGQVQEGTFLRKANGKNAFLPDDGGTPIFVSERNSLWATNGDRVKVSFMARRQHHIKEAQVIEILQRKKDQFVGKLRVGKDFAYLITPENIFASDIIIPKRKLKGGKTNDKAIVKITQWPDAEHKNLVGEVVDVIGQTGDNDTEMNTILAQYGLPYVYPKAVEEAANKITGEITPQDVAERDDFRSAFTCTIDPHDAKDFDDALSIEKLDKGLWQVGVHIADVSHYVTEGSVIDKEAVKRATSIYLVDRTIPMLPERLCNFICSLRPDEDKLAYSVIFTLDDEANVKTYRIVHTIFRFHHGSERNRLNHLRFRFAFSLIHQLIQAASHRSFCAFGFHFVTKFHNKLTQGLHLLRVRIIVNTIGKRLCFPSFLGLSDALGHSFVGQQHKLFNQLVGIVRPFKIATCGLSRFVNIEMQFFAVKLHCAMLKTFLAQRLG